MARTSCGCPGQAGALIAAGFCHAATFLPTCDRVAARFEKEMAILSCIEGIATCPDRKFSDERGGERIETWKREDRHRNMDELLGKQAENLGPAYEVKTEGLPRNPSPLSEGGPSALSSWHPGLALSHQLSIHNNLTARPRSAVNGPPPPCPPTRQQGITASTF